MIPATLYDIYSGEPVWTGNLPCAPPVGTVLDLNVGHGPQYVVTGPGVWRLKTTAVASLLVPVAARARSAAAPEG